MRISELYTPGDYRVPAKLHANKCGLAQIGGRRLSFARVCEHENQEAAAALLTRYHQTPFRPRQDPTRLRYQTDSFVLLTTSHFGPGFFMLILNRGTRSIRFNDAVGIRSTVSLTMVCVVQSYEQPMALCIPPLLAHRKRHTGGCTASNSVISML